MKPAWPSWNGMVAQVWLLAPAFVFGVYVLSMPPAVAFEDDGLFLMTAVHAGIPQPPGYPLYALVGHLASLLPFGTVPARLHALSAAFGTGTGLLIGLIALRLTGSGAAAFAGAAALGLSSTFWSQSIIAEVYAPNAFLVFLLAWLCTRPAHSRTGIPVWFGLVYGLALSLHWPLVLLSTPALAVLAWPHRRELGRNWLPMLLLFIAGLGPYAWMVWRSQGDVFINFYGPLRTLGEIRHFISREGYTEVDLSPTAGAVDKIRFARFLGEEMLRQFTPAGLVLAAAGFVAQWRRWSRGVCTALTLLFLGNTVSFLLLIYFDYDNLTRAAFRVYPHLAWGAMAIWLGLGISVLGGAIAALAPGRAPGNAPVWIISVAFVGFLFSQNLPANNRRDFFAADDYARTVLRNLPADADLFVSGDIATHTLGYMRYVEGVRPDITVYSLVGAVFANRLFEPLKTPARDELRIIEEHVKRSRNPICTTSALAPQVPQTDYWLFSCMAGEGSTGAYAVALNDDLLAYFARVRAAVEHPDAWTAYHHEQLIKRAGSLLGKSESTGVVIAPATRSAFAGVRTGFYGALGYVDGLTFYPEGRQSLRDIVDTINTITRLPDGASKSDRARFLAMRGKVHARFGDRGRAVEEFENSLSSWPDTRNESIPQLLRIYRETGESEKRRDLALRFPTVAEAAAWTPRDP